MCGVLFALLYRKEPINRINSELHLEQKAVNMGKHERLLRTVEVFSKGKHEDF